MDKIPELRARLSAPSPASEEALCDFLLLLRADDSSGSLLPLSEYLRRFPELELDVAREYLRRVEGIAPRTSLSGPETRPRFDPGPVIGRGGMGEVRRVHDRELDRELAMKTLRRTGPRARQRFLREAGITGRLDHPGVVPVHEIGTDADGQPFFTMKHVEGVDLDEVFRRVRRQDPEWSLARALEVLIKVCDTVAFAHARGIVHRDLKPSNVRVGRFGEAYVMDWGLARVLAEAPSDTCDEEAPASNENGTAVLTLDGDVLGTPAYMAPEQAEGRNAAVGKSADVYALGAMLYQLLSGERPYTSDGELRSSREVLEHVRTRSPESLRGKAAGAPIELVAIAEKAMQREPEQRYPEMDAVARDLRAFLDRRLVSAHRTGLLQRVLKWARRNRAFVVPAVLFAVAGALGAWLVHRERVDDRRRLVQLSRSQLVAAFDTLWPPQPAHERALSEWLAAAEHVLASRASDAAALEALKREALPMDADAPAERAEKARLEARARQFRALIRHYQSMLDEIDRGERPPPDGLNRDWVAAQVVSNRSHLEREQRLALPHLTYRFADEADQVLFEALTLLNSEQEKLLGDEGSFSLVDLARWGVEASRRVERLSLGRRTEWERARRAIAECPAYGGLDLLPQLGLVPLGPDPASGLWEFAHVLSGDVPERGPDGSLRIDDRSGIVLVLLPGGKLQRGSQGKDPTGRNFDPWCESNAPGPEEVSLQPFFLAKYELTLAQWERVTGRNPHESDAREGCATAALHPLENVDFEVARRFLTVLGLALPTEAQWEWGQRAGKDTPWSSGSEPASIAGHANIAGRTLIQRDFVYVNVPEILPDFEDGFVIHAPVGSFQPNAFGLHDMMGNVREWCRDTGAFEYRRGFTHIETGERLYRDDGTRVARGGSFALSVLRCRSAARDRLGPLTRATDLGIRPARDIAE